MKLSGLIYLSLGVLQLVFYCKQSKGEKGGIPNFIGPRAIFNIGN